MMNVPNYYLFNTIDDIVDRIPNTRIEQEYGPIQVDDLTEVSPFWRTILGRGYKQSIAAIGAWNFHSPKTTTKALNYFGKLFQELQNTAQEQIAETDPVQKGALAIELSHQSQFTTWHALQLCMHPRYWGRTIYASTYHAHIFKDLRQLNNWDQLDELKQDYNERYKSFRFYNNDKFIGQVVDDMEDALKDLGAYLKFYPEHATTNAVLTEFQYQYPHRELIELSPYDSNINRHSHDLNWPMKVVARENDLYFPDDRAFTTYEDKRDAPEFRSLGDRPEWWALCAPVLPITNMIGSLEGWRDRRNNTTLPHPKP